MGRFLEMISKKLKLLLVAVILSCLIFGWLYQRSLYELQSEWGFQPIYEDPEAISLDVVLGVTELEELGIPNDFLDREKLPTLKGDEFFLVAKGIKIKTLRSKPVSNVGFAQGFHDRGACRLYLVKGKPRSVFVLTIVQDEENRDMRLSDENGVR